MNTPFIAPAAQAGKPMSRWKASGIHLLISLAIGGALTALMLLVWYPWPLFEVGGGSGLMMILLGVDVVLGPLVTLVVFRAGKKGLKFDLACIAFVQLAALAYGVHAVYAVRPAYLVFTVDRFELVAAVDLDAADIAKAARPEFRSLPAWGPQYVAAVMPEDPAERQKMMESGLAGKDLNLFPQHYVQYDQAKGSALAKARPAPVLIQRDPAAMQKYFASTGRTPESVKFLPLRARSGDAAVLLDAGSGQPLKIVQVDPW
jgi:hypothetical protein